VHYIELYTMVLSSDRARNIFNSRTCQESGTPSEESSGSEFVEEEKPWPPTQERLSRRRVQKQAPRVPRPHSHLFRQSGGRTRGSKHARRWENCKYGGPKRKDWERAWGLGPHPWILSLCSHVFDITAT
jgi:hypothetical protein